MTEADLAPWVTPAIIVILIAWLRLDVGRLINRVDANLTKRIDDVNTNLGQRIDDVNTNLGQRIDDVNTNLGQRIDEVNSRMNSMEQRMQGIDDRLRAVEVAVGTVYGKLDILERYIMHRNEPATEPPPAAAE